MKKLVVALVVTLGMVHFAAAQQYRTALGVKGGSPYFASFDVKYFFAGPNAIEARIGGAPGTVFLQALYERNYNIVEGLDWYFGIGGNVGFWNYGPGNPGYHYHDDYYSSGAYTGIDAIGGIEYTFPKFPLNLAFDLGPSLRVAPYVGFGFSGNIAARFAIK